VTEGTAFIPFVDTHVHFWDLAHSHMTYHWLQPGVRHPILGDIEAIKAPRFDASTLLAEARFAGVEQFVHVQAAVGTPDPVVETEWVTAMAEQSGQPKALVAHVDLGSPEVCASIERHAKSALLRGVRDFAVESALQADTVARLDAGLRALAAAGLLLDLDCEWPYMVKAAGMASGHPDLVIVLEHLGYPRRRDSEYFDGWRRGIQGLATAPNVYCKISGIGMGDNGWTAESIAPWIEHCMDTFGPQRCVFGTNWPVDRLFSSYDAIVAAYRSSVAQLSLSEQRSVLHDNAVAIYRL